MNKAAALMILAALLLFAAGCAQVETEQKQQELPEQPIKVSEQPSEPLSDQPVVSEPVVKERALPPAVEALLSLADNTVTSYEYIYSGPDTQNRFTNNYYIRGRYIKIKLLRPNTYTKGNYFDTVYLDTAERTAVGKCEEIARCTDGANDYTKLNYSVLYKDYLPKTPYDWIREARTLSPKITGKQTYEERTVVVLEYYLGGKKYSMLVDETFGLPRKITVTAGEEAPEEVYVFGKMLFNNLKLSDVTPKE